jgi:hypothetical protein
MVHGRAQAGKDAGALKAEWLGALCEGLAKNGLKLPIPETDIHFPFYGDTLADLIDGKDSDEAAAVIVRGDAGDDEEKAFVGAMLEEIRRAAGIDDAQLREVGGAEIIERGPLNWEWVQTVLTALDRYIPGSSAASVALFTHDVYTYFRNSGIREEIETGVATAFAADAETVVIGHSLGSIVSYNLLRQQGHLRGWRVPLFVTVGSPLAITMVRRGLRNFAPTRCPECVSAWFNAYDEQDVVALYPLDMTNFPLDPRSPEIANKGDVKNKTANHHGIIGYLDDKEVAKGIYDGLTRPS